MSSDSDLVRDMQMFEHNLQHLLMQKQTLQIELGEILNALNEIEGADEEIYRVMGPVMVKAEKSKIRTELTDRKKIIEARISSIENQEQIMHSKIIDVRKKYTDDKKSQK